MNEAQTRKNLIDKQLQKAGWLKKYIKEEVNSLKSNFKNKDYVFCPEKPEKGDRCIDYLLLAQDNSPLAIIEAKAFSKDPKRGRIQSRSYQEDIEKQISYKIPIFLTNGQVWLYIDQIGRERKVSSVFNQSCLERRSNLFKDEIDPRKAEIDTKIIDRARSKLNLTILARHFAEGHRKALIQMATGTGKTRVAMALIKLLVNANIVRNVLFVADRITLADQASAEGFKKFFKEPAHELHRSEFDITKRFYATTVQTLMNQYEKFSPAFFDLIIFDEAHRSIYEKNKLIFDYFDAIKIGLTATPREHESKNTYTLFDCEQGKPTVDYPYDDAVRDKILVNYKAQIIGTEVLSLGIKGKKLSGELKDQLRRQQEDPDSFEVRGPEFDKIFMDEKTNELIAGEFMKRCYKSDEGLPCKSIFFCASQKHAQTMKDTFGRLFPRLSNSVQVITSDEYRAQDEVKRFKLNSEPRIALSVGMLDTGVDIPEVCNLVFVKPVISSIRFWQMLGRGTRNLAACKHPEWLQGRDKQDFLIFDFAIGGFSNVLKHKLKKTKDKDTGKDVITEIFKNRVDLLKRGLVDNQKKIIVNKVLDDVKALDEESFIVREKLSLVKKIKGTFDLENYVKELKEEIAPLMIINQGKNPNVSSFILKVEKLFGFILENDVEKIIKIKSYVIEMLENILRKNNLSDIKAKERQIMETMQEKFWDDLTFEKVEFIVKELAPLMIYYEKRTGRIIQIDKPDQVLAVAEIENEIKENPKLKEFIEKNALLKKIKKGEGITSMELVELERQLTELNPAYTIENVQKSLKKDFLLFIHQIIGLTQEYDPKELIEREFDKHIIEVNHYNHKQIEFLQLLKKFFADRKHVELKDFAEDPLSELDPSDRFNYEQLKTIKKRCDNIKMK